MSLSFLSAYNSPPLVAAAGAAIALGIPTLELTTVSLAALKGANALAFLSNVVAVSVPGRLDGQQQQAMRNGDLNPNEMNTDTFTDNDTTKQQREQDNPYFSNRTRTLVSILPDTPLPFGFQSI